MDAGDFPVVLHGTYMKNWQSINKQARVIMISVNKFGEKIIKKFPVFRFHGNGSHLEFYSTSQGTYNFNMAGSIDR